MKISKRRLRQIIKEEVRRATLKEASRPMYAGISLVGSNPPKMIGDQWEQLTAAQQSEFILYDYDPKSGGGLYALRSDLSADELAELEAPDDGPDWYGDRSREPYDKNKWEYRSDQEFGNRGYQGEEGWESSHVDKWAGSTYRRPRRK
ncbi:MAG TPA: hypothetical protein EYG51_22070 [Pseudomonadales bacterium]|nr:hypothetical protein [Pseudomonadales bacterium]